MKSIACTILILLLLPLYVTAQDDYSFDLSEIEKKPYTFGGYLELTPEVFWLDHDAAFYDLNFYDKGEKDYLDEYFVKLSMNGKYTRGISEMYVRGNVDRTESHIDSGTDITIDEGYLVTQTVFQSQYQYRQKGAHVGKRIRLEPCRFYREAEEPPTIRTSPLRGISWQRRITQRASQAPSGQ